MVANNSEPVSVLLAEDDDEDFLIFSLALNDTQHNTTLKRVENGELLMDFLTQWLPDLLFLDLHMPCKNGRQCIREIRANAAYDGLPVIIYSSFNDRESIEYCFTEKADRYTFKPNAVADLTNVLKQILVTDWKQPDQRTLSKFILRSTDSAN